MAIQLYQMIENILSTTLLLSETAQHIRAFYRTQAFSLRRTTECMTIEGEGNFLDRWHLAEKTRFLVLLAQSLEGITISASWTDQDALQQLDAIAQGKEVPRKWGWFKSDMQQKAIALRRENQWNKTLFTLLEWKSYDEMRKMKIQQDQSARLLSSSAEFQSSEAFKGTTPRERLEEENRQKAEQIEALKREKQEQETKAAAEIEALRKENQALRTQVRARNQTLLQPLIMRVANTSAASNTVTADRRHSISPLRQNALFLEKGVPVATRYAVGQRKKSQLPREATRLRSYSS